MVWAPNTFHKNRKMWVQQFRCILKLPDILQGFASDRKFDFDPPLEEASAV